MRHFTADTVRFIQKFRRTNERDEEIKHNTNCIFTGVPHSLLSVLCFLRFYNIDQKSFCKINKGFEFFMQMERKVAGKFCQFLISIDKCLIRIISIH